MVPSAGGTERAVAGVVPATGTEPVADGPPGAAGCTADVLVPAHDPGFSPG
ncbi:hypothetical protein ACI797_01365 [Geodermatophilus sp. SYSU D00691]